MRSNKEKALLYAAFKLLEREVEKDGELDAGTYEDVSFSELAITFPKGTVVEREVGDNGNGTIFKKAIQNLYGYPVIALMAHRLKKFHQWNAIKEIILESVKDVLKRSKTSKTVRDDIRNDFKNVAKLMDELQTQLPIPKRQEDTPRTVTDTLPPTIMIRTRK